MTAKHIRSQLAGQRRPRDRITGGIGDSFVRANSSGLVTADTGQSWTNRDNRIDIVSNAGKGVNSGNRNTATMTGPSADVMLEVTLTIGASSGVDAGFAARYSTNYIIGRVTNTTVDILAATAFSNLATVSSSRTTGAVVRLRMHLVAATILLYVDDALLLAATSTQNQSITEHGLWTSDTTTQFNNFRCRALDSRGEVI